MVIQLSLSLQPFCLNYWSVTIIKLRHLILYTSFSDYNHLTWTVATTVHVNISLFLQSDAFFAVLHWSFCDTSQHLWRYSSNSCEFRYWLSHWVLPHLRRSFVFGLLRNLELTVKLKTLRFHYFLFHMLLESLNADILILIEVLSLLLE